MSDGRLKRVAFADHKLLGAFNDLKRGKFEDRQLAEYIQSAINHLKENSFAGIKIPKRLWPNYYVARFAINNLRKYDLPNAWRLIYTLKGDEVEIVSVILEWFSHKEYEKRFKYNVK